MPKYIIALDQGTSSSRSILVDTQGQIVHIAQKEITQFYPESGYVEHDATEIWDTQISTLQQLLTERSIKPSDVAGIGITNQRETCLLWNKKTGEPLSRAIVWQDRRTADFCDQLTQSAHQKYIQSQTGLVIDAYFSASKIKWLLEHTPGVDELIEAGNLCAGTIDSWLIYKLTGNHFTDPSNASRTMLYNINTHAWDQKLLDIFNIPLSILPEVKASNANFGQVNTTIIGCPIPVLAVLGDQQASLFGQLCFTSGSVKNTYGTGCFMLMNTGTSRIKSVSGLISTIAWQLDGEQPVYALEGSVFIAGAAIQWLRDGLKLIDDSPDSEFYAMKVEESSGVYVVPAFTGLGAPYWDMYARGGIFGLERSTEKSHLIRATLESLAYQSADVLRCMIKDSALQLDSIRVDGGASVNNLLMQFQADILNTKVVRPQYTESTALGVAFLAGLTLGFWSKESLKASSANDTTFEPKMSKNERTQRLHGWQKAVSRCKDWLDHD